MKEGRVTSIGGKTRNTISKETKRNIKMVNAYVGNFYIKSKRTKLHTFILYDVYKKTKKKVNRKTNTLSRYNSIHRYQTSKGNNIS